MREKKKDKTAWKCQVQKGSMTVEAAFVMPLVLLVVFALLLLTMFVHNRAWYTAVCAEAAISASTAGIRSRQEAQEMAAASWALGYGMRRLKKKAALSVRFLLYAA